MSSILDALKKAEQNSTAEHWAPTPWPAPSAVSSSPRHGIRRWLMVFAGVAVLGVLAVIAWIARGPASRMPAASIATAPPLAAHSVKPSMAAAHKARTTLAKAEVPATVPRKVEPSALPVQKTLPAAIRQPPAKAKAVPSTLKQRPRRSVVTKFEPAIAHPAEQVQRTDESAHAYQSDSRIELQALVWSPDAASRFIIINNRLIKEGGSVDSIVVVQINRDDVLLSEGGNKWYQPFKVH